MGVVIIFRPANIETRCPPGATVLEAARESQIAIEKTIDSPCGGQGVCGRCRVKVVDGEVSAPTGAEQQVLSDRDLTEGYRLACQAVPLSSVVVEVSLDYLAGSLRLELTALEPDVEVESPITHVGFTVPAYNLGEPTSLWDKIRRELEKRYGLTELTVDSELFRRIAAAPPEAAAVFSVRDGEIINLRMDCPDPGPLGLALDLGTTKIAGYLVDLVSGRVLASGGIINPQLSFGADVMSRLAHALKGLQHQRKLTEVVVEGIQQLVQDLTNTIGVASVDVEEVVVAANTAMHHLVLGLPVSQLARAPYRPALSSPIQTKARELGLRVAPGAYVYVIPPIDGFVGGDHVAMILATKLYKATSPCLGLDIGTNTEIVLARNGSLVCCSCASGPAFEGAHISHGMRAADGALASVELGRQGEIVRYHVIGGGRPVGICGSGALDTVSELVRLKILDGNGRLDRTHPRVRSANGEGMPEFLLFSAAHSATGQDVVMTQKDVSEIQLAKAAIAAGIELVLAEEGVQPDDLLEVLIAGAFGSHLDPMSVMSVGMLPVVLPERIRQVGNAAGTGAIHALVSLSERRLAEQLAQRAKRLDLSSHPDFNSAFAQALRFPRLQED